MTAQESMYRVLPPHDLGQANSHFSTVYLPEKYQKKIELTAQKDKAKYKFPLAFSSAIKTHRPIKKGKQVLAYSGQGSSLQAAIIRRSIVLAMVLLTPALIIYPWLRLSIFILSVTP